LKAAGGKDRPTAGNCGGFARVAESGGHLGGAHTRANDWQAFRTHSIHPGLPPSMVTNWKSSRSPRCRFAEKSLNIVDGLRPSHFSIAVSIEVTV